jgi:hypothetical protein
MTTREVLELLPLSGTPVRSRDLEKRVEKAGKSWRNALRHLQKAETPEGGGVVVTTAGIVDGVPAKFYALDIARRLREYSEGFPEFQRRLDETLSPLPQKARSDLVLRMELSMLQRMIAVVLRGAIRAPSRARATDIAELFVDNFLRRWVKDIAGSAWDMRPDSTEVLAEIIWGRSTRSKPP